MQNVEYLVYCFHDFGNYNHDSNDTCESLTHLIIDDNFVL